MTRHAPLISSEPQRVHVNWRWGFGCLLAYTIFLHSHYAVEQGKVSASLKALQTSVEIIEGAQIVLVGELSRLALNQQTLTQRVSSHSATRSESAMPWWRRWVQRRHLPQERPHGGEDREGLGGKEGGE